MRFRGSIIVIASLGAASCSAPAPQPTPAPPAARPAPTLTPTSTALPAKANWMDEPQTAGDWFYRRANGTTAALFGDSGTDARFAVTCILTQRRVTLARSGTASGPVTMGIRTESADRAVTASPSAGNLPSIVATLPSNDPLLDAIAFSKGRFAVEVPGESTLYLPSWPEITRVIEDCR